MSFKLISSPLQGFTDYRFRNAQDRFFGGIDVFYAPYIRLNGKLEIKPHYQRDLQPKNNQVTELIPQVMCNTAEEFLFAAEYVQSLGYNELNWNLGCPYPMVVNKCMGSGLIKEVDRIDAILDTVHSQSSITVSMKMRMGYDNNKEILKVFPILQKYPIKNIGIHARIGKQLYEGGVDLDGFERCLDHSGHKIYYNGDITSVEVFRGLRARFPSLDHWMIGRGLIADPFLADMIKRDETVYPDSRMDLFLPYHNALWEAFEKTLDNTPQVIQKMYSYWEYFSKIMEVPKKALKKMKKAKSRGEYTEGLSLVMNY